MDSILAQIGSHLDKVLKEEDFKDCFLIDSVKNETKVQFFIDADTGMTFENCRKISRLLEAFLDEKQLLGEKYTLEVSSPGAKAPLKQLRQYPQHVGRKIKISLLDDEQEIEGELTGVKENLLYVHSVKGKGKKKVEEDHTIEFEKIEKSIILLAF